MDRCRRHDHLAQCGGPLADAVTAAGPAQVWARLRHVAATQGWPRALAIAARWSVERRFVVCSWDLAAPPPAMVVPAGVTWAPVDPAAVPRLAEIDPTMTPGEVRRRQAEGQQCQVGWCGADLAYYRWQSTAPVFLPYVGLTFHPDAGDLLVVDVFTSPRFRGRGIGEYVSAAALARAHAAGLSRAIWLIAWWNVPALRIARQQTHRRDEGTVGRRTWWARQPFATGAVALDGAGGFRVERGPARRDGRLPGVAMTPPR